MTELLFSVPAFVKVALAFGGILVAYRLGLSLGLSIIVHSLILTVWSGAGANGLRLQALAPLRPENYLLMATVVLLLFFTEALGKTGRMERTVNALKDWLASRKALIAGLPALIGLLPMPGGALVSAPLVDSVDAEKNLDLPHKVAINYWFRHIWEYWWPLYPGVILAIRYSELSVLVYSAVMLPFTIVAVASGYFFILRKIKKPDAGNSGKKRDFDSKAVGVTLGPIALIVACTVVGSFFLERYGMDTKTANLLAMTCGLAIALVIIFAGNISALKSSVKMFQSFKLYSIMLVVIGVLAFSEALKMQLNAEGATLVSVIRDEFFAMGMPIIIIVALLPAISGFVTGVAVGFTGVSFPLVFALLGPDPALNRVVATTLFAYSFGYMGMMVSPVHICFLVTNEYFKSQLYKAYRYLWGPVSSILLYAIAASAILYVVL